MKNRIFALILSLILSLPVTVWAVDNIDVEKEATTVEVVTKENDENQYKQPISKRKIAKKFLAAMAGVAASSFIIFFLLTLYNKVREGYVGKSGNMEQEVSLESPDDMLSAVKTFLAKTKW